MTCNSETVSRQNLLAGNITKSMTSESNGHPRSQRLFMRGLWCQAFTAVASARVRRSIWPQTPRAKPDSQGSKWPIPSKDKSTCKMSFERRGLLPSRNGEVEMENGTLQCSQPYKTHPFSVFIRFSIVVPPFLFLFSLSPK